MSNYDLKLMQLNRYPLRVDSVDTFVVNFGLVDNPLSMHYYSEALPSKKKNISSDHVRSTVKILENNPDISLVEITGTSPETHPEFKYFIKTVSGLGKKLAVVTNPASFADAVMDPLISLLADNKVKILAFVPHYDRDEVDRLTGQGTFDKTVAAFKKLNDAGYSQENTDITTAMVYFPPRPELAGDRVKLADAYRNSYIKEQGLRFNHFIVFNTIPIGKFGNSQYMNDLEKGFNPETLKNLPCRHALSIGPDGMLYDCDFMVAANRPVTCGCKDLDSFDYQKVKNRSVATSDLCFICTEGVGATCAECFT